MPSHTSSSQAPAVESKLSSATDDFIKARLPDWLRRASQGQIRTLRNNFNAHQQSQERLRHATRDLIPLQGFAEAQFQALLSDDVPAGTRLADLRWVLVSPDFSPQPGAGGFSYGPKYTYSSGLMRLMQGFGAGTEFYLGSGLAVADTNDLVVAAGTGFIERCRARDVGRLYQLQLDQVYDEHNLSLLAEDKRTGFRLAIEVAVLKGQITAGQQLALREIARHVPNTFGQSVPHSVKTLSMLGQPLSNSLVVELRAFDDVIERVLLYLPGDPRQALRQFTSLADMHDTLAAELQQPGFRTGLTQQVSLRHRSAFQRTLDLRLKDPQPDLQIGCELIVEDAFLTMARMQVRQVKDDARLLLVPTAEVDDAASSLRMQAWSALGSGLFNVAGLFIPAVGALLLGQLLVQTLSEVFEGVMDWSRGHQHEALEHLLSVAETAAFAVASVGAVAMVRSAFVDALEPIAFDAQGQRLWANDLQPYEATPEDARLQPDGLFGAGKRRWLRVQGRFYEVHRPQPQASWQLRHPLRDDAYGPHVLHNGERGWRLMHDRPLEWNDSARMLDCLWPQDPPIDAQRAEHILKVSGIDQDELRGVVVENRPAPVNLADTLRRFEVDARIEAFISHLRSGALLHREDDLLAWCSMQPEVAGPLEGLRGRMIQQMPLIRRRLFESFAYAPRSSSSLAGLISRDFPGLPKGFIPEVLKDADANVLEIAHSQRRLPVLLASKARSLLRVARLTRALEGFYLSSARNRETDALAIALLHKLPGWPAGSNLELTAINAVGGTTFEAIVASLSPVQLQALALEGDDAALQLRQRLLAQLPASHEDCAKLLGWAPQARWFNPGQRLPDGRVGYLLSGRGEAAQTPRQTLHDGLRRLFPGLDDNQLSQTLEQLLQGEDTPFAAFAGLQDDHEQLNLAMNRWVHAELNDARRPNRQLMADCMLRAWRGQGERVPQAEGEPAGLRMILGFADLSTLPPLPGHVQFSYVTSIAINDTSLSSVPNDFLHSFTHVRTLNLNGNRLLTIPTGIAHMARLRTLRMARNLIRLNASAVEALASLPQLARLDLSYNPLGALHLRFNQLQHLVHLNLRHCRLAIWPAYIELCQRLQLADLRDNQLTAIAPETMQMPQTFRQAFLVDRNRLSNAQVMGLYALDEIPEFVSPEIEPEHVRSLWLDASPAAQRFERGLVWEAVAAAGDSDPFIQLLGQMEHCADYANAREYLGAQVWALLEDMQIDASLRSTVFELAAEMPQAENRTVDVFSRMQLRLLQARAARNAAQVARVPDHIALGIGLYRLDFVALLAREAAVQLNEARAIAAEGVAHVDAREIELFYRVRLRQALNLPGQPQTLRGGDALGVSDASIEDVRQRIERVGHTEELAEDLSQRSFWQRYLSSRYTDDFRALDRAYRARIDSFHAENPNATPAVRAHTLEVLDIEHQSALHRHRVALTRYELRSQVARRA